MASQGVDQLILRHLGTTLDTDFFCTLVQFLSGLLLIPFGLSTAPPGLLAVGISDPRRLFFAGALFPQCPVLLIVEYLGAVIFCHVEINRVAILAGVPSAAAQPRIRRTSSGESRFHPRSRSAKGLN